jgi:hypothetical protein
MRRKAVKIGFLLAVLLTALLETGPVTSYCRIAASTRSFREYFHTLDRSRPSLNTVERVVFSLLLSNARTRPIPAGAADPHRTS